MTPERTNPGPQIRIDLEDRRALAKLAAAAGARLVDDGDRRQAVGPDGTDRKRNS